MYNNIFLGPLLALARSLNEINVLCLVPVVQSVKNNRPSSRKVKAAKPVKGIKKVKVRKAKRIGKNNKKRTVTQMTVGQDKNRAVVKTQKARPIKRRHRAVIARRKKATLYQYFNQMQNKFWQLSGAEWYEPENKPTVNHAWTIDEIKKYCEGKNAGRGEFDSNVLFMNVLNAVYVQQANNFMSDLDTWADALARSRNPEWFANNQPVTVKQAQLNPGKNQKNADADVRRIMLNEMVVERAMTRYRRR